MSNHTPGPWHAVHYGTYSEVLWTGQNVVIAVTKGSNHEGNADAIAAAPELLAEAELFRCVVTSSLFRNMTVDEAMSNLRKNGQEHDDGAAIAKAKSKETT